jgi:sugar phosphate isomerase/epimerase
VTRASFGVSPAYFFSRFTTDFTVEEIASALPDVRMLGFKGFQLEIYHPHRIQEWKEKGPLLAKAAQKEGLIPTQFVAHFLLHSFDSETSLFSEFGKNEIRDVMDILKVFPQCRILTVPIPAFQVDPLRTYSKEDYRKLHQALLQKLDYMLKIVTSEGIRMALEIVPASLVGGIAGFLQICSELKTDLLGYNFDTGHAYSSKEILALIPAQLNGRIYGTHLKDTFGVGNAAFAPGSGSISWPDLVQNLQRSGYQGSWDLEIVCPAEKVEEEYRRGLSFLQEILEGVEGPLVSSALC